jgi:hypothetical protein
MKILKDDIATLKRKRRVVVELDPGEHLLAIHDDRFYRLGEPLDEVMAGHIIGNAHKVEWCSLKQGWVEA